MDSSIKHFVNESHLQKNEHNPMIIFTEIEEKDREKQGSGDKNEEYKRGPYNIATIEERKQAIELVKNLIFTPLKIL